MSIISSYVLPDDVIIVGVEELAPDVRSRLEFNEGDVAITRPRARTPSKIVDKPSAELVRQFRSPTTIVEAIIRISNGNTDLAETILIESYPLLRSLIDGRIIVPEGSTDSESISAELENGLLVGGFSVASVVQVLEDTEIYRVQHTETSVWGALKILRTESNKRTAQSLHRERDVLRVLGGCSGVDLLETGVYEDRPYLVMSWCEGDISTSRTDRVLRSDGISAMDELYKIAIGVVEVYVLIHEKEIVHSDVHPRNVLISKDNKITVIDFGLAHSTERESDIFRSVRGGFGPYYEPEFAQKRLEGKKPPSSTQLGEQYAVAALVFRILTGSTYVDFSPERDELYRQIAEDSPRSFYDCGGPPWREMESVLGRALDKDPRQRFVSMKEFLSALRQVRGTFASAGDETSALGTPRIDGLYTFCNNTLSFFHFDQPFFRDGVPVPPRCSVNFGAGGIAYALYRLSIIENDPKSLQLADAWSCRSLATADQEGAYHDDEKQITPEITGDVTPYHTLSGLHVVKGLIANAMGDIPSLQSAIEGFVGASQAYCENLDVTLGRSGTLIGCSLLIDAIRDSEWLDLKPLFDLGENTMREVWSELDKLPHIGKSKNYNLLGIAHGWSGLCYAALRWCRSSGIEVSVNVRDRIEQLTEFALDNGESVQWPNRIRPGKTEHELGSIKGWCNGSAGHTLLWILAHKMLGDQRYGVLAERSGLDAFDVNISNAGLCCGNTSQAYAMLSLYTHFGEKKWLRKAELMAVSALNNQESFNTLPHSLFQGRTGLMLLVKDLHHPETSCMPFFEPERWPKKRT